MSFIKKLFGACFGGKSVKRKHPICQVCYIQYMTTDKKFDDERMRRYPLLSNRQLPVTTPVSKEMVNWKYAKEHRAQTRKNYLTVVRNRKHYTEAEQLFEVYAEALDRRDIYGVGA